MIISAKALNALHRSMNLNSFTYNTRKYFPYIYFDINRKTALVVDSAYIVETNLVFESDENMTGYSNFVMRLTKPLTINKDYVKVNIDENTIEQIPAKKDSTKDPVVLSLFWKKYISESEYPKWYDLSVFMNPEKYSSNEKSSIGMDVSLISKITREKCNFEFLKFSRFGSTTDIIKITPESRTYRITFMPYRID